MMKISNICFNINNNHSKHYIVFTIHLQIRMNTKPIIDAITSSVCKHYPVYLRALYATGKCKIIIGVDQGGGRGKLYLFLCFDGKVEELVSCNLKDVFTNPNSSLRQMMNIFEEKIGQKMTDEDHLLADLSGLSPDYYSDYCNILSESYKCGLARLLSSIGLNKDEYDFNWVVRQTGKLRKVLFKDPKKKVLWEKAMIKALGTENFALLSNEDEALFESMALFKSDRDTKFSEYIFAQCGSSSTQACNDEQTTVNGGIGAKPTTLEKKNGKSSKEFTDQFRELLDPLLGCRCVLVALNAIGYIVAAMSKWLILQQENGHLTQELSANISSFQTKITKGCLIQPKDLYIMAHFYHSENRELYGANYILGFADYVLEKGLHVQLERKGINGKPLSYKAEWIPIVVQQEYEKMISC
jgi:hypothetical protein